MTPVVEYLKYLAERPESAPNDKEYSENFKKTDSKDSSETDNSTYFKDFMELIDKNIGSDVFLEKVEKVVGGSNDKKVRREAILQVLGEYNLV